MKLSEAYKILNVPQGAKDEAKTAFRKLAAQYHPDRNKDEGAEAKFKEINSAYQAIENPERNAEPEFQRVNMGGWDGFSQEDMADAFRVNIEDLFVQQGFSGFRVNINGNRKPAASVKAKIDLSFSEAALGVQKEISFDRKDKCDKCDDNNFKDCKICNGTRLITNNVKFQVKINPGITNSIRLHNVGDQDPKSNLRGDVIINVNVQREENMDVEGLDIISLIELTLLEALKGVDKKVKTIKGEMSLKIKPGVKNLDRMQVRGFGIGGVGSHVFLIKVNYPENTSKLIEYLEKE